MKKYIYILAVVLFIVSIFATILSAYNGNYGTMSHYALVSLITVGMVVSGEITKNE